MRCVDRYILGLLLRPMLSVIGITVMLLLLENLLRLIGLVLQEAQPTWVVSLMLISLLPEYLGLAIPIGLLLGVALAFRSLSISNELASLSSAGLSSLRLLRAPLIVAAIASIMTEFLIGFVAPHTEYLLQKLIFEVRTGQFGVQVRSGENLHLSDKVMMRVEKIDPAGETLESVFLSVRQNNKTDLTLTAAKGHISLGKGHRTVILHLEDGNVVNTNAGTATPNVIRFRTYDFPLKLPAIPDFRQRGARDRELSLNELWALSRNQAVNQDVRETAAAKIERRLVLAVTALFLPVLAIPMGVPPPRSTTVFGVVLGLIAYILYLKILDFIVILIAAAPVLLWLAFGGFVTLICVLFRRASAGGHPLTGSGDWLSYLWTLVRGKARLPAGSAFRSTFGQKMIEVE